MAAPSPRVRATVSFGTPLVTHVWKPAATEVSIEPMQEEKERAINDSLSGQSIWPTVQSFLTRASVCNALFRGHPVGYQSPPVAAMDT